MKNNMDLSLKNKEWKEFKIDVIFNVGTGANVPKKFLKKGNIPRISATEQNNGVVDFTELSSHKNFRTIENFISVSFLGAVFYHSYKASLDMKIHSIQIKERELNKYLAEFIVIALKRAVGNTSYGNQVSSSDLPNKKVYLPVNSKGEPDYEFMEAYMRSKEQEKINAYKKHITSRIVELENTKPVIALKDKKWKIFKISELFNSKIGKKIDGNKVNKNNGSIAYITRKENNNGVDGFIDFDNQYLNNDFPVITIGNETAEPFVQNYPFFTGTKVNILIPKENISVFALKFIATSLRKHKSKYSYSFTINSTRLKKQKIILPIDKNEMPDFEYMENYMKNLELERLKKYLKYKMDK